MASKLSHPRAGEDECCPFGSANADSDIIKWEAIVGNRGMTPFASPGAPAQVTSPGGISEHSAMAAYWKE